MSFGRILTWLWWQVVILLLAYFALIILSAAYQHWKANRTLKPARRFSDWALRRILRK